LSHAPAITLRKPYNPDKFSFDDSEYHNALVRFNKAAADSYKAEMQTNTVSLADGAIGLYGLKSMALLSAFTYNKVSLSLAEILRIENAATRIGKPITVVGSRASGTAKLISDWDYVIEGITNRNWKKIKNSLPGAKSFIDNTPSNIDLFKGSIDVSRPYITILSSNFSTLSNILMKLKIEFLLNKYAQGLLLENFIFDSFRQLDTNTQHFFLECLANLIVQSNAIDDDINQAIINSGLKPTYTPCVLLLRGSAYHNLNKIIRLPHSEYNKILYLFLNLFKIAYLRRFEAEKNDINKWWYWDLSIKENIETIESMLL
jgi:hypothetical protein